MGKKLIENEFIWRIKMRKTISELPPKYIQILYDECKRKLKT